MEGARRGGETREGVRDRGGAPGRRDGGRKGSGALVGRRLGELAHGGDPGTVVGRVRAGDYLGIVTDRPQLFEKWRAFFRSGGPGVRGQVGGRGAVLAGVHVAQTVAGLLVGGNFREKGDHFAIRENAENYFCLHDYSAGRYFGAHGSRGAPPARRDRTG